ncbi:hypothetical protein HBH56_172340 [Parastagonospora nodorum]|uniref:Uncharacterized protein n=1 Tax=Phaeosphaeria nodorum (strain SN15 / ATCC MYA-4574 / FGSC 10173) TaxID=321614 RepID=A0A7U2EXC0_PHANO|nr:hypothetical protein HBH56_172340 [Parastagonospora nodorum]QRC94596.1 hypothetical protein JI435_430860 [Parastagonospora nodorum SN15]KAH3928666.1 hypothetical protein HBH54_140900 [Parastagonospora nodorum]KAH4003716.1 hypothetical protein HBI10_056050 [Parastagonospora nodorum]KAH4029238.1 hypothetical protein HBI13_046280 [Parastagonospora nodorum]
MRYFTTSKPQSVFCISQPKFQIQARARTHQTANQVQKIYATMSNNQDLKMDQVFNVKDKVALVTGGGSGIGVGCQYLNGQTVTVDGGYAIQVGN